MRKLKLFNGRWLDRDSSRKRTSEYCSAYIAAYSVSDAVRVINGYLGYEMRCARTEVNDYWSKGCWGNSMDGIIPERGMWIQRKCDRKPVRVA